MKSLVFSLESLGFLVEVNRKYINHNITNKFYLSIFFSEKGVMIFYIVIFLYLR